MSITVAYAIPVPFGAGGPGVLLAPPNTQNSSKRISRSLEPARTWVNSSNPRPGNLPFPPAGVAAAPSFTFPKAARAAAGQVRGEKHLTWLVGFYFPCGWPAS